MPCCSEILLLGMGKNCAVPWQEPLSPEGQRQVDFEREIQSATLSLRFPWEQQPEVGCAEGIAGSSAYSEGNGDSRILTWTEKSI